MSESNQNELFSGFSIKQEPAPLLHRAIAMVADYSVATFAIYAVAICLAVVAGLVVGLFGSSLKNLGLVLILILALLASIVLLGFFHWYFIHHERKYGATPGKKLMGLRVISLSGERLTGRQVVVRDFMRYIDLMLVLPGLISVIASSKRQRLGDMMAGTMVVYSASREEKDSFFYVSQDDYWRFHDALKPLPVDDETVKSFSLFAYQQLRKREFDGERDGEKWVEIAKRYISNPDGQPVEPLALLRFFAEHCRRQGLAESKRALQ